MNSPQLVSHGVDAALQLGAQLVGVATLGQALEMWQLRRHFASGGPWPRAQPGRDFFTFFALAQIVASLALVANVAPPDPAWGDAARAALLTASTLCAFYFAYRARGDGRGSFNGGADTMTYVVGAGLALASATKGDLRLLFLSYVGAQSALSYFVAGAAKIAQPGWRNGTSLRRYRRESAYCLVPRLRRLDLSPFTECILAWALMIFELSVVWVWMRPEWTAVYLAVAMLFHLFNFFGAGLNRFVWIWLASYPALWTFFELLRG